MMMRVMMVMTKEVMMMMTNDEDEKDLSLTNILSSYPSFVDD
jgi:hypothetical protein